jgi:hypothetical protein
LLHNHPHLSSGAGTVGQKWPQYKGLSPTPLTIIIINNNNKIYTIGWDGIDWIDQAQDRDQWRALVNTVMNLRVP